MVAKSRVIVIEAGIIANPDVLGGRMIPHVIIDSSKYPQIEEYILSHKDDTSGDVLSTWGILERNRNIITLNLKCYGPSEVEFTIQLPIDKFYGTIDQIVCGKSMYLQCGKSGDRISSTIGTPYIILEIQATGFKKDWSRIYQKHLERMLAKDGVGKKIARDLALQQITHWRILSGNLNLSGD